MAENEYLRRARAARGCARQARHGAAEACCALGLNEQQIASFPKRPGASLRAAGTASRQFPAGSRSAAWTSVRWSAAKARKANSIVIVDLSEVWVELAVPPADLPAIREGQEITVASAPAASARRQRSYSSVRCSTRTPARPAWWRCSPILQHVWRPGTFVTAEIPLAKQHAGIVVPKAALQTIKGERVVFVRNDEGFEARKVTTGREDEAHVEIVSGLVAGRTDRGRATRSLSRPNSARPKPSDQH